MTDPARIAAVYGFLEGLLRDRSRLVAHAGIDAWAAAIEAAPEDAEPGADLFDAVFPWAREAADVTCLADPPTRAALAGRRGVRVEPMGHFEQVCRTSPWTVAVVDRGDLARTVPAEDIVATLARAVEADPERVVVLIEDATGVPYDQVEEAVFALGGGRVFGLYPACAFGVVEFGDVGEEPPQDWGEEADGDEHEDEEAEDDETFVEGGHDEEGEDDEDDEDAEDEEDDVPVVYDNALGPAEPEPDLWIAVCGPSAHAWAPEGLTLVELDGRAFRGGPRAAAEADAALVAAREQELRWRLEQAEAELAALRARPVEELEAKVAELEARLRAHAADAGEAAAHLDAPSPPPQPAGASPQSAVEVEPEEDATSRSQPAGLPARLVTLEGWIRRLEAGGPVAATALLADLRALARSLRRELRGRVR